MPRSQAANIAARLRKTVEPGLFAVRTLWLPFALIQLLGLAIVLSYFYVPAVTRLCDDVAAFRARAGVWFALIAMPIACGIVPEIFKFISGVDRSFARQRLGFLLHNTALFFVAGFCVDRFYALLGTMFGTTVTVPVIIAKVAIDQFLYTPIIATPLIAGSYTIRAAQYRLRDAAKRFDVSWYAREVGPVLVTCWAYWIPMTTLMYTLPPKLTLLYGVIASAASSILLTAVAGRSTPKDLESKTEAVVPAVP